MTCILRTVVLATVVLTVLGCGGAPEPPKIDPTVSKQKSDEIGAGMQKAMEAQMKGKKN